MAALVKEASKFADKLISPAFGEFGELLADQVRSWRAKNRINIILKTKKYLEDKGIEYQQVPVKVLYNILEDGSLEEDEHLQNMWASLLASAANPDKAKYFSASFTDILKQMSSSDALILNTMFDFVYDKIKDFTLLSSHLFTDSEIEENLTDPKIDKTTLLLSIDNLLRFNLIRIHSSSDPYRIIPLGIRTYNFTFLGLQFISACKEDDFDFSVLDNKGDSE